MSIGAFFQNNGGILATLLSIATLIGFLTANARAKGKLYQKIKDICERIVKLEVSVEEQFSQRNATNIALERLSIASKENMEWVKEALKRIEGKVNHG